MTASESLGVAVLISGEGTNLQALIDAQHAGRLHSEIRAVISDKKDARGLERARRAGIPALHIDPQAYADREAYDSAVAALIDRYGAGLVVLAGYMRILSNAFIEHFNGRIINIHPSLLPKFKGLHTHRRVLAAEDRAHGATVHFVTADLDSGPPVFQYRIAVGPDDTEATLSARVHVGEYIILCDAVARFATGRLYLADGAVMLDGAPLEAPMIIQDET